MNQYTRINCWLLYSLLFFSLLFSSFTFLPFLPLLSRLQLPYTLQLFKTALSIVSFVGGGAGETRSRSLGVHNVCKRMSPIKMVHLWFCDVCAEDYCATIQLTTAYGTLLSKLYPLKLNCLWNYICSVTRVLCSREKNLRVVFSLKEDSSTSASTSKV